MLIICEDCAKKYNIDESRIRGNRARFTCKACGHIIIVNKSDTTRPLISSTLTQRPSFDDSGTIDLLREMESSFEPEERQEGTDPGEGEQQEQGTGIQAGGSPILLYFLAGFLAVFISICGAFGYLYTTGAAKGLQAASLGKAVPSLGIAGAVILIVFFLLARLVSQPIKKLQDAMMKISRGEGDVNIAPQGPREVQELAVTLIGIRSRTR
jgi:predicted Zn finger-like uncharacterized protein